MRLIQRRNVVLCLFPMLLSPRWVLAQGRGRGQQQTAPAPSGAVSVFTSIEIGQIRSYYAAQPPGALQPLPPGIARNLARGKPLPPGIAKRYAPAGLVALLTPRSGAEMLVVGANVVLVDRASRVVIDIVANAVLR